MTLAEVQRLVQAQSEHDLSTANSHRITLAEALTPPEAIRVVSRTIQNGGCGDELLEAWLVGQEKSPDGYKIILQQDGRQFGLASSGFPGDEHLILIGWYGTLESAFLAM